MNKTYKLYRRKLPINPTKKKPKVTVIQNKTPQNNILLAKLIQKNLHINNNSLNNTDLFKELTKKYSKSFSPTINKYLISITQSSPKKFLICNNNLLTINIGSIKKPICLKYSDNRVKKYLLNNLKSIKNINCDKIIPPKQYLSNCWFNTMFVTFFISDKGRKFFKFFRQLMIEGKQLNGNIIPKELSKAFFILNIAIEASHNNLLENIAYNFNTNLLIKKIHYSIKTTYPNLSIPQIKEAGNPLDYYKNIMLYLNNNVLNMITIPIYGTSASSKYIASNLNNNVPPEVIIVEIYDNGKKGAGLSKNITNKETILDINNIKYFLDSSIIRDTTGQHFCSLLTCNSQEYCYDGASYSRLSLFNWKSYINKNKLWKFKGHNLKWNFRNGYQLLFYYRI